VLDPEHLPAAGARAEHDGADHRVEAGAIPTAGHDADALGHSLPLLFGSVDRLARRPAVQPARARPARCATPPTRAMIDARRGGMVRVDHVDRAVLEGENFVVRRGDGPLLLTCEHAARAVPDELERLGLDEAVLDEHWGWDRWAE